MAGNLAWEACKHSDYWVDFLQSKTCPLYRITRFQEFGSSQTNVDGCEIKQSEGKFYLLPIWAKHWCFDWNSICHQSEWSFQSNCWQSFIQTQVGNRVFFIYAKQVFQSVTDGCFSGVFIEWLGLCCSYMSDGLYHFTQRVYWIGAVWKREKTKMEEKKVQVCSCYSWLWLFWRR